ncbi:MAG: AAA family ATPase [Candidatus Omnitrophica bacterium]|nr:AAA family ATPase [Candidatus Omnitrophota bacterium]
MKIISVVNQKGGCGKTTLAVNMAAALAKLGYETLLIDLDPQAHATYALGYTKNSKITKTAYDLFAPLSDGEQISYEDMIINDRTKLSFIPSNMMLSTAEISLGDISGAASILNDHLANEFFSKYDYILVDSPPSFGFLTLNSIYSSNLILVPVDISYFSFNGVNSIYRVTSLLEKETGKKPDLHFMLNIFDGRSKFSREFVKVAEEKLGKYLFDTKIRSSVRLREAAQEGKTIFEHDSKSSSALDFYNATCELVNIDSKEVDTIIKEFFLNAPSAGSVYVLGDFNGWKRTEANKLSRLEDGKWSAHYHLPKGRYRYKYLVDGNWVHDPNNERAEPNIFGSVDSIAEF